MKNNRTLWYQVKEDFFLISLLLVIYGTMLFVFGRAQMSSVTTMDIIVIINYFIFSDSLSYSRYHQYITFGFSRRKFYKEQIINGIIRGTILSIYRSAIQWIYAETYIQAFFFQEEELTYAKVPFIELFITNLCFFILIQLVLLLTSTAKIDLAIGNINKGYSPQLKQRIQEQKNRLGGFRNVLTIFIKMTSFIMMMFCSIFMFGYYEIQLTNPLSHRIIPIIIMLFTSLILYLLGKNRFRPEYI